MKGFPRNATERADHPAVRCETESLTHAELDTRSSALARVLADDGVVAGDRLGIMLPNCIEFIECLAATAKLEVASLTINWHLAAEELAWILADSDVGVLVADPEFAEVVRTATADRPVQVRWSGDDYERALAAAPSGSLPYRWPTSWPVIYTSGTTGRPKGVVHGAMTDPAVMEAAQDALADLWGYTADDVHLVAGPLYHMGPAGYCNSTLYAGGTVVLMESWDPREFLRQVEAHRATTTFLTPAHFIRLLEVPERERRGYDVSSLRQVIHAGAPCPRQVKEAAMELFDPAEVWELYGMSEGGATRVSPHEWRSHPGTVGRPWPGVEIEVRRPASDERAAVGEDGLIWIRPAHGRFHYHGDEEKTADAWSGDRFTVGDVGHLDDEGYLYLTDRLADVVIRSGVNVYPREIEEVLHRHPQVVDCAVFGVPDDRDGERLVAVVEAREPVDGDELRAHCAERLDRFKVPSTFELCRELPRDLNGKILKRRLRDPHWADAGRRI